MKQLGLMKVAAGATLLLAALSPRAVRADSWDKKTYISFSDSVQVPGTTLPAGKYVFKLWNSQSDRYTVQIFNERENHIFATLLTVPDYRMNPPDKTIVSFYEAPAGQPQPIKVWFYPGDNNGRKFVYSKAEADVIAKAAHEPVATEQISTVAENTTPAVAEPAVGSQSETDQSVEEDAQSAPPAPAQVAAEPEEKQESPMVDDENAEDQQPTTPPPDPATATTPAAPATDNSSMPSTGSELPLAGLIGLTSIGAAVSVRALRHARRNEVG
jgi:hypothetical protein